MGLLLSNEAVVAAAVGAVLGALSSHFLGEMVRRRTRRQAIRREAASELVSIVHDNIAALMSLHTARIQESSRELGVETRRALAQLTRQEGRARAFEIQLWQAFQERKVRAAYHKTLTRLEKAREFILQPDCPSPEKVEIGVNWVALQLSETAEIANTKAGLPLRDPARIVFVGFRKVTDKDKRLLSFEDTDPPWLMDSEKGIETSSTCG